MFASKMYVLCSQKGSLDQVDPDEPYRLGQAVRHLELNHVVITSVNRDDLTDGERAYFRNALRVVKQRNLFAQSRYNS